MRTLALTLARAQPARAAVGACVHAGQGEAEPAFPRPLLSSLSSLCVGELYIPLNTLSCPHPEASGVNRGALSSEAEQVLYDL